MLCSVCGRKISYTFYLCKECEEKYGRRADDRPAWVNFLINNDKKERTRNYNEIPFSDLEIEFEGY